MLACNCIVGNEAHLIPFFIEQLKTLPVEEIVLVCNGTDESTELLFAYAKTDPRVKIVTAEWHNDFAEMRNIAIDNTTSSHILKWDCDDKIDEENIGELKAIKAKYLDDHSYCLFNTKNTNSNTFTQTRIFPRILGVRWEGAVHENVVGLEKLEGRYFQFMVIEHVGYCDPGVQKRKSQRNLEILLANPEDNIDYFSNLAQTYMTLGDYINAIKNYNICLVSYNYSKEFGEYISYTLGKIYEKNDEFWLAMHYYLKSHRRDGAGRIANLFEHIDLLDLFIEQQINLEEKEQIDILSKKIAYLLRNAFLRNAEIKKEKPDFTSDDTEHIKKFYQNQLSS